MKEREERDKKVERFNPLFYSQQVSFDSYFLYCEVVSESHLSFSHFFLSFFKWWLFITKRVRPPNYGTSGKSRCFIPRGNHYQPHNTISYTKTSVVFMCVVFSSRIYGRQLEPLIRDADFQKI